MEAGGNPEETNGQAGEEKAVADAPQSGEHGRAT